jgi:hypothetical protein
MPFKIVGSTSGNVAEVDSVNNLLVTLPQSVNSTNSTKVGHVFLACGPQNKALTTFGPLGRLATGVQTMELFDPIDGAAINSMVWTQALTGAMTVVQNATTGFLVLNAGTSVAINLAAQINSIKTIQLINTFVPTVRILYKTPNVPQTNATMELGFLECSGTTAPTNGAFLRWNSSGEFRAVTVFNSVEQQSAVLTNPSVNVVHTVHIVFRGTKCEFWQDEVLVAEVTNAAGNPAPTGSSRVGLGARVYTGGTSPVLAPELHLAAVSLWRNDLNTNKLWPFQMCSIGRGAYQSAVTPYGQSANHANSTSPTSATLSNTAAGYTTLGGRFQFAAPASAVTDFALFGFQVPTGFQMFITDFAFNATNTGAAVATTATIIDVGVGLNASAVSLATVDGFPAANTFGPRRIPLGHQSWIVAAGIGTGAQQGPLIFGLETPWLVDSARFFHVIIQVFLGTATASQVIRGDCYVGGYLE